MCYTKLIERIRVHEMSQTLHLLEKYLQATSKKISTGIGYNRTTYWNYSAGRRKSPSIEFYVTVEQKIGVDLYESHYEGKLVISNEEVLMAFASSIGTVLSPYMDDCILRLKKPKR